MEPSGRTGSNSSGKKGNQQFSWGHFRAVRRESMSGLVRSLSLPWWWKFNGHRGVRILNGISQLSTFRSDPISFRSCGLCTQAIHEKEELPPLPNAPTGQNGTTATSRPGVEEESRQVDRAGGSKRRLPMGMSTATQEPTRGGGGEKAFRPETTPCSALRRGNARAH